jgi:hypothetical protein
MQLQVTLDILVDTPGGRANPWEFGDLPLVAFARDEAFVEAEPSDPAFRFQFVICCKMLIRILMMLKAG